MNASVKEHTLTALAARATTQSATAPAADGLKVGQAITGQWLYDEFIAPSKEETTRVQMIERLPAQVDVATFQGALKDMVELSVNRVDGDEAKATAKKTATSAASALKAMYGAMRFAGPEFSAAGFKSGVTGYRAAYIMAQNALKAKKIHWSGVETKSAEQKDAIRAAKLAKTQQEKAMEDNPQNVGESFRDWMLRCADAAEAGVEQAQQEARYEHIAKLAKRVIELCKDDINDVMLYLAQRMEEPETENE